MPHSYCLPYGDITRTTTFVNKIVKTFSPFQSQCAGRLYRFQIGDTASRVTFRLESGLARRARDIGLADGAIVAHHDQREELDVQIPVRGFHPMRHGGGRPRIENDEVGLLARFNRTDVLIKSEGPRVAESHSIEGLRRRPGLPVELENLVTLGRGAQHRIARSAADICGERDAHPRVAKPSLIEQARAQKQIGRWAEGRDRPARRKGRNLALREMNAMAEYRARSHKPGAFVDFE